MSRSSIALSNLRGIVIVIVLAFHSVLAYLASLPPEPLEETEKLEQLRALALGRRIHVGVVEQAARGVDTPADYERFVALYRQSMPAHAA